ncbi:glycerophosphocholine cholinephosphodiesterase ENPP6-like [Ostrea edulis]|uniref:glycerophosphocholine cholinephosphodiesterase ENPP6-like n=1 Tax=Ostrea edulis TaxID=37623 RepID=UPI0024AF0916|nr:glycerophosphocholine cholinephosphodiesterase ENPP6-like [Ostrea edulis]XP_056016902.1 glycerophosphocholine cholinephosphodiesterase ENPP6-like [Ostrea edulis]
MFFAPRLLLVLCSVYFGDCSKLVVILMDGFRWDYFDNIDMPGFADMAKDGVKAEYIVPDYPSISYPNYYSIMTGLHCESHGMVGNFMYDSVRDKNFLIGLNPDQSLPFWWDDAEPLWVTAEKQGKKSYMFYWPGCDARIRGVVPTYCEKYTRATLLPDFEYSLQQTLGLLANNSADMIGIYLEVLDLYGHRYGVNSVELNNMLADVDKTLLDFRRNLSSLGLNDDVNIVIFSDHGMVNITKIVNITDILNISDIKIIFQESSFLTIWPVVGQVDKVYKDLVSAGKPNITVYKKEALPDRYHIRGHQRTAPIVIEPDKGVAVVSPWKCSECSVIPTGTADKGIHGYDNLIPEMRAIFRATGPAFKKNYTNAHLANIELYQIMCNVLGIKPNNHNGTWNNVVNMMTKRTASSGFSAHPFSMLVLFIVITCIYGV